MGELLRTVLKIDLFAFSVLVMLVHDLHSWGLGYWEDFGIFVQMKHFINSRYPVVSMC